jgi:tRNA G10  N-methylase Trm11
MVGGGTTLVESCLLGREAIGYDIDPLAWLVAKVKSYPLSDAVIERAFLRISSLVEKDLAELKKHAQAAGVVQRATPPEFHNRDYWFLPSVSKTLALLSHHIANEQMRRSVRDFLWVAFSSLILARTSVANARDIIHSRHHFFRHPEPPDVMTKFKARVKQMRQQMQEFVAENKAKEVSRAYIGDARRLCVRSESIDLVFTSPPYVTAIDYSRAHFLAVPWMTEVLGVTFDEYLSIGPSYIGTERGRFREDFTLHRKMRSYETAHSVLSVLEKTSPRHAKLTQRYFLDMHRVFTRIARVLKVGGHAIMVVCPSHIRKVPVPTHTVFTEMGKELGLRRKKLHTRTINERRRLLPYMLEEFGKRMDTEYVIVFQKS